MKDCPKGAEGLGIPAGCEARRTALIFVGHLLGVLLLLVNCLSLEASDPWSPSLTHA